MASKTARGSERCLMSPTRHSMSSPTPCSAAWVLGAADHLRREVDAGHPRATFGQGDGELAAAAPGIEHAGAGREAEGVPDAVEVAFAVWGQRVRLGAGVPPLGAGVPGGAGAFQPARLVGLPCGRDRSGPGAEGAGGSSGRAEDGVWVVDGLPLAMSPPGGRVDLARIGASQAGVLSGWPPPCDDRLRLGDPDRASAPYRSGR